MIPAYTRSAMVADSTPRNHLSAVILNQPPPTSRHFTASSCKVYTRLDYLRPLYAPSDGFQRQTLCRPFVPPRARCSPDDRALEAGPPTRASPLRQDLRPRIQDQPCRALFHPEAASRAPLRPLSTALEERRRLPPLATMSAQTQAAPAHQGAGDLAPQQLEGTPAHSPSGSTTEHTPQFQVEPPTPRNSTDMAGQQYAAIKEAQHEMQQHEDPVNALFGTTPPDYESGALRAPGFAYSRHHPYARSQSSYEDLSSQADSSHDGGPARTRRSHSQASSRSSAMTRATSYESLDGDYQPEDGDGDYVDDADQEPQYIPAPTKAARPAKEPVRLTATGKPSHARRLPPGHIKRPRNAFILFRSHACVNQLVPASLGITDHRHISRIVGQMWKNLPAEERKVWEEQAEKEKEEHRRAHPDYKYRPVYRKEGVVRRRRKKPQDTKEVEEEERKCEVVARVLLEGGDISEDRVEKELEIQRERDEIEGRVRGPAARSPSRSQRRQQVAITPRFDMNYGMVGYGQQVFDLNQRRGNPGRSASVNVRYNFDGQEEDGGGGDYGGMQMQRSHTMPPLHYEEQGFYGQHFDDGRGGRAPAPQPLSLFRPNDTSLAPPANSPGLLFGTGVDLGHGFPSTPRTLAMQQHQLALQQRLRGSNGTLLSPRAADFGLSLGRRADAGASELPFTPSRPFHQDGSLGFEHGFLDNALGAEAHEHGDGAGSVDAPHIQRSYSADAAGQPSRWQQPQYHVDGNDAFLVPGKPGSSSTQSGENNAGQQGYSALGEMAAGSNAQNAGSPQSISFQPDANTTYVFLDAIQAQDQALVDSIRAQGFGITLDASQEEIAKLTSSALTAH